MGSAETKMETSIPDGFSRRIVVLGKTGAGKSSLANTLFGGSVFIADNSPKSGTITCKAASRHVHGKEITFIDTPGFFDTDRSEEEMKQEITKCITECAPGPHVFLIVLKVEKFTVQEKEIVGKMREYFSEEALKYATVLFTHGDQLPDNMKIEEFVNQSKDLSDLIKKCGGRCNVIDNKYWKKNQDGEYRSNEFQVKKLLCTIDEIIEANNRGYYSNEILQAVLREIDQEQKGMKGSSNLSQHEITQKAKSSVTRKVLHETSGVRTAALLKVFLNGAMSGAVRVDEPILTLGMALTRALAGAAIEQYNETETPAASDEAEA